jgi:hypothetical protein
MMAKASSTTGFFGVLKSKRHVYSAERVKKEFASVSRERVEELSKDLCKYIIQNLPAAFEKRNVLADYRTNPYVLMTSASAINLSEAKAFGKFLFDSKLYMALETSFGKSIEAAFLRA